MSYSFLNYVARSASLHKDEHNSATLENIWLFFFNLFFKHELKSSITAREGTFMWAY